MTGFQVVFDVLGGNLDPAIQKADFNVCRDCPVFGWLLIL